MVDVKALVMSRIGTSETSETHVFVATSHAGVDDAAVDAAIDELLDDGELRSTIIQIAPGRTCPGLVRTRKIDMGPPRHGWIQFPCSIT